MGTMKTSLKGLGARLNTSGPFVTRTLADGTPRIYVRGRVAGKVNTVAICQTREEAERAYQEYGLARAWQEFPPMTAAQRERLEYYARTVKSLSVMLQRLLRTYVHPIPCVTPRRRVARPRTHQGELR